MPQAEDIDCDALILGGGIAGLWTLDRLGELGCGAVLVEPYALGAGQTIWSQGIIHGGLKYTLRGLLTRSAESIRDMPDRWRRSLAGEEPPDLRGAALRGECCHLWHSGTLKSRASMFGARVGLRTRSELVPEPERPDALRGVPGDVARVGEVVIEPGSVLACFARRHAGRVLKVDEEAGVRFEMNGPGEVTGVVLRNGEAGREVALRPGRVVLCAGNGNAELRAMAGLEAEAMQVRPLRMVMVRGERLPWLNGHCVDGMTTRVTVTSSRDSAGRVVWQLGGEVAEAGARLSEEQAIRRAEDELRAVLPGVDFDGCEWSTYEAPRAEGRTPDGRRPEEPVVLREGNVVTVWPTKLALAPVAAELVAKQVAPSAPDGADVGEWPAPEVAAAPWEEAREWRGKERAGA